MDLDISALVNATARLREGLERYEQDISDTQIRDGLIQRFEFTYELSHKMLKRFLEMRSPNPQHYDEIAFQDLVREGNESNLLLGDWEKWKTYRQMRTDTSHTYKEDKALKVVAGIPDFLREAEYLLKQLQKVIDA